MGFLVGDGMETGGVFFLFCLLFFRYDTLFTYLAVSGLCCSIGDLKAGM